MAAVNPKVNGFIQVDGSDRETVAELFDVWAVGCDVWTEVQAEPEVEAAFSFTMKRSRFIGLMKALIRKEVFITNAFWV